MISILLLSVCLVTMIHDGACLTYKENVRQIKCSYELSTIDFKCDTAYEITDHKIEVDFAKADRFCKAEFKNAALACINGKNNQCSAVFKSLEKICRSAIERVRKFRETEYIKWDTVCNALYNRHATLCKPKTEPAPSLPKGLPIPPVLKLNFNLKTKVGK